MTTLYKRLTRLRDTYNISIELLQQDYLLAWMLAGIAAIPELKEVLIFKGGTALKKAYFGAYRFSQDLDFTIVSSLPDDKLLAEYISAACVKAMELQSAQSDAVKIVWRPYTEKNPHPHNQKAFVISAQFPWHREPLISVMVEITTKEPIILQPEERALIHTDYNEQLVGSLKTYKLEEIVAEKVRAILQFAAKLHEKGWARSRARDYYDLWRILHDYGDYIDRSLLPRMVNQKCVSKDVHFTNPSDLFTVKLMENLDEAWMTWLKPYVPGLPRQELVIKELRTELEKIWEK